MEIFQFFRMVLILTVTVAACWPLNLPLIVLAYKVRNGPRPLPLEDAESLWPRATLASFGLAVLAWASVLLDYFLVAGADLPPGMVHVVFCTVFIGVSSWFLFWSFAFDDFMEGVGVLLLYIGLPGIPLFLLWLIGFTLPLAPAQAWLAKVS